MNKLLKKLYAVIGVLVMLLPIALSAVSGSVKAEGETKDTQTVVLTKLGFTKEEQEAFKTGKQALINNAEQDISKKYNALQGIKFEIYDVTKAYNALSTNERKTLKDVNEKNSVNQTEAGLKTNIGQGKASSNSLINDKTTIKLNPTEYGYTADGFITNEQGQITVELPKDNKIYIFHEIGRTDLTDKTYDLSKDLVLSLPQFGSDSKTELEKIYLYPKNFAINDTTLKFMKISSSKELPLQPLKGAQFVFSKTISGTKFYAKRVLTNSEGKEISVDNQKDAYTNIKWVQLDENQQFEKSMIFESDSKGIFTVNAKPASATNFSPFRKVNVDSYGIAVDDVIQFEEINAPAGYDKLPKGSFTIKNSDENIKTVEINSENANQKQGFELPLGSTMVFADDPTGLLPHTGGMGIVLFVLAGVSLIAVGAYAYKKQRA